MKKYLNIILFLFTSPSLIAMTIQSGRPGESIGAEIISSKYFQVQSGMAFSDSAGGDSFVVNNVLRHGINDYFELRAVLDYSSLNGGDRGVSATQVGLRSKLVEQASGLVPQLAFQTHLRLNFIDSNFKSTNKGLVSTLSMVHSLAEDMSLTHNFGINFSGNSSASVFFWTSNLAKAINDKWGWYGELYGNRLSEVNTTYGQTGLDYLLSSDTKVDFSFAKRIFDGTDENIISFGISSRFSLFSLD